jgi:hypothetical protein
LSGFDLKRRRSLLLLITFLLMLASACNLIFGIDEQGPRPAPPPDVVVEAQSDAPNLPPGTCNQDSDCAPTTLLSGCYTPRCDVDTKTCLYGLCEIAGKPCARGTCNVAANKCEGETTHGFRTTTFPAPSLPLGCGGDLADCMGPAWPFMLVGSVDGVIAVVVDDPIAKAGARTIPVVGFTGRVAKIVITQSPKGRRAWILAPLVGDGGTPTYEMRLATIDIPGDPTITQLVANTTTFDWPYASVNAFPAPDGKLYLSADIAASGFPTILLEDVPPKGTVLAAAGEPGTTPPGAGALVIRRAPAVPVGSILIASSGARLIATRTAYTIFDIIENPGLESARVLPPIGANYPGSSNVPSIGVDRATGGIMMASPINGDLPPPDCNCSTTERVRTLFLNATATAIDVTQSLDLERYSVASATPDPMCRNCTYPNFLARLAPIDNNTALVATAPQEGPLRARASVRLMSMRESPPKVVKRSIFPEAQAPSGDISTERSALVSMRGLGFLYMSAPPRASISIYDPRCDVADGGL